MHVPTGEFVEAATRDEAARKLAERLDRTAAEIAPDIVMVDGNLVQIEQLADRVRLGSAERERRNKRRQQQRESRRANR